jgi:hypothetical protein
VSFQLYLRATATNPDAIPQNGYQDLIYEVAGSSGATLDASATEQPAGERPFLLSGVPVAFWGERLDLGEETIQGDFAVYLPAQQIESDATLKLRARLYKITTGGSAVETLLGTADSAALTVGSDTTMELAGTFDTSVQMAIDERLLLRVTVLPVSGGFGAGDPVATLTYNTSESRVYVDSGFPTFKGNLAPIFLRDTATSGIGDFYDALEAPGGAVQTVAQATSAGGTEITWTRPVQAGTVAVTEIAAAVIASTANATTYASASFTPVADRLYLLAVCHSDAAPETTVPTITTTTGLTFVQVGSSIAFDTIASNLHRITLFRAMKPSGLSAGTYTVTLADAGTGCAAILAEVTGINTTGTDGANAIGVVGTGAANGTANPFVSLAGLSQTYNGVFACVGSDIATAPTPESGYTALSDPDYATPTTGLFAEWKASNFGGTDSPACTLAASDWGAIAVELVAATTTPNLEWISGRFTRGWIADTASIFSGTLWLHESNALANAGARIKVYHRLPDGTETLVYTWTSPTELATTATGVSLAGGTLNNAMTFHEDDRLVIRLFLTNVGTMADGHTGTVHFNALVGTGASMLTPFASFRLKPESQGPSRITDGQNLSGVGN